MEPNGTWYWERASSGARLVDGTGAERARIDGDDAVVGTRTLRVRRGRDRMVLTADGVPILSVRTDWAGCGYTVGSRWQSRRWTQDGDRVTVDQLSIETDGRVEGAAGMDPEESAALAVLGWARLERRRVLRSGPPRNPRTTLGP